MLLFHILLPLPTVRLYYLAAIIVSFNHVYCLYQTSEYHTRQGRGEKMCLM